MFVTFVLSCLCVLEVISGNPETKIKSPAISPDRSSGSPVEIRKTLPKSFKKSSDLIPHSDFKCTKIFGDFHDDVQCDKFWRCEDGLATSHICEDGLVFDINKADGRDYPCDTPYVVDCQDRKELQYPTFPSIYCPRAHGYFAHPDPTVCNVYYTCIKGVHRETTCSYGLHFSESDGICNWPSLVRRENCQEVPRTKHSSGFVCPEGLAFNSAGIALPHPSYPNSLDCQLFYVCLNGVTPQEASCDLGQVFNERSMICDYPENVKECVNWYKDDPRFYDYYYDEPIITDAQLEKKDA